jgi:hypothetical protein
MSLSTEFALVLAVNILSCVLNLAIGEMHVQKRRWQAAISLPCAILSGGAVWILLTVKP